MGHIWLVPTPRFERSNSIKIIMRNPILDVGCTIYSFIPKTWWKSIRLQHTSSHLLEASILTLSHTILLKYLRNRVLHMDSCIFKIINEIKIYIFTTIIRYEDLEFPPRSVFNQGSKDFEEVKKFRLML